MLSFKDRMIGAAKLDAAVYEEVEADRGAMGQAMAVVVLSSLAAGIGSMSTIGFRGLIVTTLMALVSWYIWAFLTFIVGTKLLPQPQTQADYGQLLRTIGFSSAPGILRVLGIIPFLSGILLVITSIWMLVAMVIAVRQALDYTSTWRAVGVCLIGWLIQSLAFWLLFSLTGAPPQPAG
jgi:hypothetical protein